MPACARRWFRKYNSHSEQLNTATSQSVTFLLSTAASSLIRNVNVMLQCLRMDLKKMCMSSVLTCIRHRLAVKTCADALKSLSTVAELAGVQCNFIKAFATAG